MSTLSFIIGGFLGALIGLAFYNASAKDRQAKGSYSSAKKARDESAEKAKQAKDSQQAGNSARWASFDWTLLGFILLVIFGAILLNLGG